MLRIFSRRLKLVIFLANMGYYHLFCLQYIMENEKYLRLRIPANSPGFPGSLQVFHEISRSPG